MYHFILNPASRSGIAEKIWFSEIEPYLNKNNTPYLVHFSQESGDITALVKEILDTTEGICRIIILGGDGALNEALQGITDFSRVMLGIVPIGSSNDLTRDMNYPNKPFSAIERILSCKEPTPMDFGRVHYEDGTFQNFLVSCGIGYDAAVCEETNHSQIKRLLNKIGLGKLVYLSIALKQLTNMKPDSATLTPEGQDSIPLQNFIFLAGMNHQYEGGGFRFAPNAKYTDGLLNLCAASDISKRKILMALPAAFKGKHYKYKGVTEFICSSYTIETSTPLWVHVDGEVSKKSKKITVECHKNELMFLI